MVDRTLPGTFYDMLRSFVTLGQTLNPSKTSRILKITRQTVMRHLSDLEKIRGQKLLVNNDRKYALTREGLDALPEARELLDLASHWGAKSGKPEEEFAREMFQSQDEYLYVQEHPIIELWNYAPPLLLKGFECWTNAGGRLEDPAFQLIRPYILLFKEINDNWVCVEVGEKSSLMSWLGWTWGKSAVGTLMDENPIVSKNGVEMARGYRRAADSSGICYEHICARLPRPGLEGLHVANYQRLIVVCSFPNGDRALATIVARTNNIDIRHIPSDEIPVMPEKDLMEFKI